MEGGFPTPTPGLSASGFPGRMGQFRPWVTEFDRKNCDVSSLSGLSLLSAQGAKDKSQMANLKDVDLGG